MGRAISGLGRGLLAPPYCLLRALARARVRLRALTVHRQAAAMAETSVGADLLEPLDRLRALTAKIALHLEVAVDVVAKLGDLGIGEVAYLLVGREPELGADLPRRRGADAVDVRQSDLEALLPREINSCNSCQFFPSSALSLLVARVRANDQHLAVPLDHAAAVTHGFHGRSDFHENARQATARHGPAATLNASKRCLDPVFREGEDARAALGD